MTGPIGYFGPVPDERVLEQAENAAAHPNVVGVSLMADNHLGYAVPIGSVVAYRGAVSPSGVGYDIGCGVKAIKTNLTAGHFFDEPAYRRLELTEVLDEINDKIEFGVGRSSGENLDHPVMDHALWNAVPREIQDMKQAASQQLGTVGAGNHYVDILVEDSDEVDDRPVWIACHFGSRGLGHKIATHFLKAGGAKDGIMEIPLVFTEKDDHVLFHNYRNSMQLAGEYAYAGRDIVLNQVLEILGAEALDTVHNHHNYAWEEVHNGEPLWVVRKGATPARAEQRGFVGGSMGDIAAVVEGTGVDDRSSYQSTVHGAGRIHSRTWAKGKTNRKTGEQKTKGNVTRQMMGEACKEFGVVVRGGDVDESPFVYRKLDEVLTAQGDTINVNHRLRPIGVVMAGSKTYDPWKD